MRTKYTISKRLGLHSCLFVRCLEVTPSRQGSIAKKYWRARHLYKGNQSLSRDKIGLDYFQFISPSPWMISHFWDLFFLLKMSKKLILVVVIEEKMAHVKIIVKFFQIRHNRAWQWRDHVIDMARAGQQKVVSNIQNGFGDISMLVMM